MSKTPQICPACAEIVLAWVLDEVIQVVPEHPDRIDPFNDCAISVLIRRPASLSL